MLGVELLVPSAPSTLRELVCTKLKGAESSDYATSRINHAIRGIDGDPPLEPCRLSLALNEGLKSQDNSTLRPYRYL